MSELNVSLKANKLSPAHALVKMLILPFKQLALRNSRLGAVIVCMGIANILLASRLAQLHVLHHDFLNNQGKARSVRIVNIPTYRGMITDRKGAPLAISTPMESIWVDPKKLVLSKPQLEKLATSLDIDVLSLTEKLARNKKKSFLYLKRGLPPEESKKITALKLPGVQMIREFKRYYPGGKHTSQLVGYTNIDDIGQAGIEYLYNDALSPVFGKKRVLEDRMGNWISDLEEVSLPKSGENLALSIDLRIQAIALEALEQALEKYEAKAATLVMLDVTNGEVISMVSAPSYNPNNLAERNTPNARLRALMNQIEPGSTIKPFTMACALESGQFKLDTLIDTHPGRLHVGKFVIKDVHNNGQITLKQVLARSSNVGISKVIFNIEETAMLDLFSRFGLGSDVYSFPGENSGRLPSPSSHQFVYATHAFGYGLTVNATQLAGAYATLANRGIHRPIKLTKSIDLSHLESETNSKTRVLDQKVAEDVVDMLQEVTSVTGTGRRAQIPGFDTAGKTGTIRVVGPNGYDPHRHIALFAGFTPVKKPKFAAVVIIEEPKESRYYGGEVAAPIYAKVVGAALQIMNIPPER
jgi:cell division protein FtsI (penicillin-binding protein 3)